jgi:hypothetical protein
MGAAPDRAQGGLGHRPVDRFRADPEKPRLRGERAVSVEPDLEDGDRDGVVLGPRHLQVVVADLVLQKGFQCAELARVEPLRVARRRAERRRALHLAAGRSRGLGRVLEAEELADIARVEAVRDLRLALRPGFCFLLGLDLGLELRLRDRLGFLDPRSLLGLGQSLGFGPGLRLAFGFRPRLGLGPRLGCGLLALGGGFGFGLGLLGLALDELGHLFPLGLHLRLGLALDLTPGRRRWRGGRLDLGDLAPGRDRRRRRRGSHLALGDLHLGWAGRRGRHVPRRLPWGALFRRLGDALRPRLQLRLNGFGLPLAPGHLGEKAVGDDLDRDALLRVRKLVPA